MSLDNDSMINHAYFCLSNCKYVYLLIELAFAWCESLYFGIRLYFILLQTLFLVILFSVPIPCQDVCKFLEQKCRFLFISLLVKGVFYM